MTKLQEARERVREANAALDALGAKYAAEDVAQAPAKAALERHLRRYGAPVVVLTAGSYRIFADGVVSLNGYGWESTIRAATDGYKGKARDERAAAVVANGELTFNLGGSSLKCKGLAQKLRVVTATHLSTWRRAHEKVRRAQEALRAAEGEERATIAAAFEAGDRMTADQIAAIAAHKALLQAQVRPTIGWARDRAILDARKVREDAEGHLGFLIAKTPGDCPCGRCCEDRRNAEYEAKVAARRKEEAKAAAARQRIKDRAPWREFTCPSCGKVGIAQVLPYSRPYGPESNTMTLRCPDPACGRYTVASAVKSKPAKKPEVAA